jgi:hypothetical protein
VKKSLARPDDGVHRYFHDRVAQVTESVMDKPFVASLLGLFRSGHRERRFRLPTLLWLGIFAAANATRKSMSDILDTARDTLVELGKVPLRARTLTQSGWSRAKQRLPLGVLRRVWRRWVELARLHAGEAAVYRGMHLVALDKKSVRVPEALWAKVGSQRSGRRDGPAQVEMLVAYDVCVRVPLEVTLGRANTNERPMAFRLLRNLPNRSLVLVDAGFYSIAFLSAIVGAGHQFLTRMRSNGTPTLLKALGPNDGLYEIRGSASYWRKKDPAVPRRLVVRIVTVERHGYRPRRLVTSLVDPQAYPAGELDALYHDRWHIETFFRELSGDVEFEHWHTQTLKGLYVELLFYLIYVSVVRAHMAQAAVRAGLPPGRLSFGRSADACLRAWHRLALLPATAHEAIRRELREHLSTLVIDQRPGRRFERDTQKRRALSRSNKAQTLKGKRHAA